jgi:hypothetical protein
MYVQCVFSGVRRGIVLCGRGRFFLLLLLLWCVVKNETVRQKFEKGMLSEKSLSMQL